MSQTKKAIMATDKSTKALTGAATTLSKVANEFVKSITEMSDASNTLAQEIELQQNTLDNINETIALDTRKAKAELEVQVLENEDKVLTGLMQKRNFATITKTDLGLIERDLAEAKRDITTEIEKAVSEARTEVNRNCERAELDMKADHNVAMATLKADNTSLQARIDFLTEANNQLQDTIKAEREARVEMSKSSQVVVQQTAPKA